MNQHTCLSHKKPFQHVYISEKEATLMCTECFLQFQEQFKDIKQENFITLKRATEEIDYFISKTSFHSYFPNLFEKIQNLTIENLSKEITKIESEILNLQTTLKDLRTELQNHINTISEQGQIVWLKLLNIIQFDEFKKTIYCTTPIEKQALQLEIFRFFNSDQSKMQRVIQNLLKNLTELSANQQKSNYEIILKQFNLQMKQFSKLNQITLNVTQPQFENLLTKDLLNSKLITETELYRLTKKLKTPLIKQADLVYYGLKNDLCFKHFWKATKRQQQLFMIFRNQKNHIFGGYLPSYWLKDQQDEPNIENQFLFKLKPNLKFFKDTQFSYYLK